MSSRDLEIIHGPLLSDSSLGANTKSPPLLKFFQHCVGNRIASI